MNTSAQVGGALGLAVLATLSATRSDRLIHDGQATANALTSGYHLAFLIGAVLVLAGIAVAVAVVQPESRERAQVSAKADSGREPAYSEAG